MGKTYKSKTNTLTNRYVIRRTIQGTYYKTGAVFRFSLKRKKSGKIASILWYLETKGHTSTHSKRKVKSRLYLLGWMINPQSKLLQFFVAM